MTPAPLSAAATNVMAWAGLALMTASFAVLVIMSPPVSTSVVVVKKPAEPFTLVILDPGHGGQDSGAMAANLVEKNLTLDIAQRVDRQLTARSIATLLTRIGDSYVPLADRAALSNRARDAVFVSIHCNDGLRDAANGVETYFAAHQTNGGPAIASWLPFLQKVSDTPNVESQSLAAFIQQEIVTRTQANDRGTKAEQFYVLANVRHPAVLVETGFLTNKEDISKLNDPNYREQLAIAITGGIVKYRETLGRRAPSIANGGREAE